MVGGQFYFDPRLSPDENRRFMVTCRPLKLSRPPLVLVSISANLLVTVVPFTTLNSRTAEPAPVVGFITTPVIRVGLPRTNALRPRLPTYPTVRTVLLGSSCWMEAEYW